MKPLTYRNYHGSVEVDTEDNILHGSIQFINDLVTYEASDVVGLKLAFQEAVDDYLATCAEVGKDADRPSSGQFNVRTGPELHRRAQLRALQDGTTLNAVVVCAMENYLSEHPPAQKHHHTHDVPSQLTEKIMATATSAQPVRDLGVGRTAFATNTAATHVRH